MYVCENIFIYLFNRFALSARPGKGIFCIVGARFFGIRANLGSGGGLGAHQSMPDHALPLKHLSGERW